MPSGRRYLWFALLAAALVFLTSCGSTDPAVKVKDGTLNIVLDGASSAKVLVQSAGGSVFNGVIEGTQALELAPGTYRVDGMPKAGMLDPTNIEVQVVANQETKAILQYQAIPVEPEPDPDPDPDPEPDPKAVVTRLELLSVLDGAGMALPSNKENNFSKDVWLYAAQTEQPVCITVRATDASGAPVADTLLDVQVADAYQEAFNRISVIRGCATFSAKSASAQLSMAGFSDSVMTDANGEATFTLYATSGPTGELDADDIAKIVVAVSNEDGSSVLHEFKIWFANITHLYYSFDGGKKQPTGQRVGASFEKTNIWDANDRKEGGADNSFDILSSVYQKQPADRVDLELLGYFRYDIVSEKDKNGADADVAHLEYCDPSGGDSCYSYDGFASLVPNDDIWLEDLPISATVCATLVVEVQYGSYWYEFDLKSYCVTKTWVGSYLDITKQVDHHVLTWYGDNDDADGDGYIEYTLDPANAVPAGSVFTATFSITATNNGTFPVYDVTITDGLPAELGVLEETLKPAGGTYDSLNHAVTWNYQTAGATEPKFKELAPGDSITVTFQVYLRQKPGYCVDEEDLLVSEYYMVGFIFGNANYCYDDPYDVINGAQQLDVTASWFVGAPADEGGTSAVVDFNGYIYEDQVIIWGVRPVFTLDKRLVNTADLPFEVGMDALFDITIVNNHRKIYDWLEALYPDEFDGATRANPYGRDIYLVDDFLFEGLGLDFTSAGPLNVSSPAGSFASHFIGAPSPPPPFPPYLIDFGDKLVIWETAPLMDYRSEASARIVLDNDLPGIHLNLAGFLAGNLNQFDLGDCPVEIFPGPFSVLLDCAYSLVLEPNDPYIELSAFPALNIEGLDLSRQTVVEKDDEFVYVFTIQNGGSGIADGTTLEVQLDNANATLLGAEQYIIDASGGISPPIPGSFGATSASFGPYDHPVGYTSVFVLYAKANKVGTNSATATATWNATKNHTQYPLLPLSVKETVSIKPPTP